jgi:hypothetical protein
MQYRNFRDLWDSVARNCGGDPHALHAVLDVGDFINLGVDDRPLVQVNCSDAATCKGGPFLVRTTAKRLVKADHFAARMLQ